MRLSRIASAEALASKYVFPAGYSLQVRRVDARPIAAQMVDL
jgi:hypothetical protein